MTEKRRQQLREAQARYARTEKGKATQHRYAMSEKAREAKGRYYEHMPFHVYAKTIMASRRRRALKRMDERRTRGQVPDEG